MKFTNASDESHYLPCCLIAADLQALSSLAPNLRIA